MHGTKWLGFHQPCTPSPRVLTSSCLGAVPAQGARIVCSLGILGQAPLLQRGLLPCLPFSAWLQSPGDSCLLPLPMLFFYLCFFSFGAKSSVKL